jgi:hypothetical protein
VLADDKQNNSFDWQETVLLHLHDLGLGMIPSVCVHNGTGLHVFLDALQYNSVLPHVLVPHWHDAGF